MTTLDIAIHVVEGALGDAASRPLHSRVSLLPHVWVGPFDRRVAEKVIDCCEPRSFRHGVIARTWAAKYAFAVENVGPVGSGWDTEGRLRTTIALSRLIRSTSIGYEYAARIEVDGSELREVVPAAAKFGLRGYIGDSPADWLTEQDALALANIAQSHQRGSLPDRVSRALWFHEYAAWTKELMIRWPIVVTGIESLVHTSRSRSTSQFVKRVVHMAREVMGGAFSERDARAAYDLRSGLVHGASVTDYPEQDVSRVYGLIEEVLRLTLLRCIQDEAFASHFESTTAVEAFLPL